MTRLDKPNYTQTPNVLFDELLPDMGLAELKVVLCVFRETFGWHRDTAKLSIRGIARATGLTPRNVMVGAAKAEARGIVKRTVSLGDTTIWQAVIAGDTGVLSQRTQGVSLDMGNPTVKESTKESERKEHARELSELEKEQANAKVTAMLQPPPANHYPNRDKIPDQYLAYADTYHEVTGQEPTKRVLHEWLMTFSEWLSEGIQPEHIRAAYKAADGKFSVTRPGALTNTAAAIKAKGRGSARRSNEEIDPAEWIRVSKQMHAEAGG